MSSMNSASHGAAMDADTVLEVEGLSTKFFTQEGTVNAVDTVSFSVETGEVFGVVGESGSGKSVTALSVMGLIKPPGEITDGSIRFRNEDLAEALERHHPPAVEDDVISLGELPQKLRRAIRGREISMVFQDPSRSFNGGLTVGEQVAEAVEVNRRQGLAEQLGDDKYGFLEYALDFVVPERTYVSDESYERAIELLELVGIPDPELRADEYPHQFSGGMLQRAMIARALAGDPTLLIADEPTSALDVTIQSQVLEVLDSLRQETGLSILLISHNFGVIARMCNRIGVMYAGQMVEQGTSRSIFEQQVHPYTSGLIGSVPDVDAPPQRLEQIEGVVPNLIDMPDQCLFADRCPKAMDMCYDEPPQYEVDDTHDVKCYLAEHEYTEDRAVDNRSVDPVQEPGDDD